MNTKPSDSWIAKLAPLIVLVVLAAELLSAFVPPAPANWGFLAKVGWFFGCLVGAFENTFL